MNLPQPPTPGGAAPRRRYLLARPSRLSLDGFARQAGLHPELVRRFVALGLLEAARDPGGELWFSPAALATVARIQRLRAGLCLNYAAIGLVLDLLDRVDQLEAALHAAGRGIPVRPGTASTPPPRRDSPWT